MVDANNPGGWESGDGAVREAWQRLGVDDGMLAVVGGTDVFGLFLNIGYDAFFLTRAEASVPRGRPVFPGVGQGTTPEDVLAQHGMVLRQSRVLDAATGTVLEEWGPKG
jgi:dihydrofolate reductase